MSSAAKMIAQWQIIKIWTISSNIGMSKDNTHDFAGVNSLKKLTAADANEVISRLEQLQGSYTPPKKSATTTSAQSHKTVAGMATAGQVGKAWALLYSLKDLDEVPSTAKLGERMCGIITKELGITVMAEDPFKWISSQNANKLIEVLKKYIVNARKKVVIANESDRLPSAK